MRQELYEGDKSRFCHKLVPLYIFASHLARNLWMRCAEARWTRSQRGILSWNRNHEPRWSSFDIPAHLLDARMPQTSWNTLWSLNIWRKIGIHVLKPPSIAANVEQMALSWHCMLQHVDLSLGSTGYLESGGQFHFEDSFFFQHEGPTWRESLSLRRWLMLQQLIRFWACHRLPARRKSRVPIWKLLCALARMHLVLWFVSELIWCNFNLTPCACLWLFRGSSECKSQRFSSSEADFRDMGQPQGKWVNLGGETVQSFWKLEAMKQHTMIFNTNRFQNSKGFGWMLRTFNLDLHDLPKNQSNIGPIC